MSNARPESGAMKFGDDWTGVFFRGDDAFGYALALQAMLDTMPHTEDHESSPVLAKMVLKGLLDSLFACDERNLNPSVRQLRPFDECLPTTTP
jgi:hypothetical protein